MPQPPLNNQRETNKKLHIRANFSTFHANNSPKKHQARLGRSAGLEKSYW